MKILTSTPAQNGASQVEIFCSIISITVLRINDYSIPVQVVAITHTVLIQLNKTK